MRREFRTLISLGEDERANMLATREMLNGTSSHRVFGAESLRRLGAAELIGHLSALERHGPMFADWEDPDRWVADGTDLDLRTRTLRAVHTPGHTLGHVVYHGFGVLDRTGFSHGWQARDSASGEVLFGARASGIGLPSVAVADGILYAGAGAYDATGVVNCSGGPPKTCTPLWSYTIAGSTPAVSDGLVYVTTDSGELAVFPAMGCGQPTCAPTSPSCSTPPRASRARCTRAWTARRAPWLPACAPCRRLVGRPALQPCCLR